MTHKPFIDYEPFLRHVDTTGTQPTLAPTFIADGVKYLGGEAIKAVETVTESSRFIFHDGYDPHQKTHHVIKSAYLDGVGIVANVTHRLLYAQHGKSIFDLLALFKNNHADEHARINQQSFTPHDYSRVISTSLRPFGASSLNLLTALEQSYHPSIYTPENTTPRARSAAQLGFAVGSAAMERTVNDFLDMQSKASLTDQDIEQFFGS